MIRQRTNTIDAGTLKDRCSILEPTFISNGRGGYDASYAVNTTVWCNASPARDTRQLEEAAINFDQPMTFIIRVQEVALTNDWKIIFNGRTYTIHSIVDIDNRYQYWSIFAYSNAL